MSALLADLLAIDFMLSEMWAMIVHRRTVMA